MGKLQGKAIEKISFAAHASEVVDMVQRLPRRTNFSVSEAEWMETLNQLLEGRDTETLWVFLASSVLNLFSKPYQLRFEGKRISLLSRPPIPSDPPCIECDIELPGPGSTHEKRTNEKGDVRLSVVYFLNWADSPPGSLFAELVISTSKEFLTVSESEAHVQ
jgi:hypothetical protein